MDELNLMDEDVCLKWIFKWCLLLWLMFPQCQRFIIIHNDNDNGKIILSNCDICAMVSCLHSVGCNLVSVRLFLFVSVIRKYC